MTHKSACDFQRTLKKPGNRIIGSHLYGWPHGLDSDNRICCWCCVTFLSTEFETIFMPFPSKILRFPFCADFSLFLKTKNKVFANGSEFPRFDEVVLWFCLPCPNSGSTSVSGASNNMTSHCLFQQSQFECNFKVRFSKGNVMNMCIPLKRGKGGDMSNERSMWQRCSFRSLECDLWHGMILQHFVRVTEVQRWNRDSSHTDLNFFPKLSPYLGHVLDGHSDAAFRPWECDLWHGMILQHFVRVTEVQRWNRDSSHTDLSYIQVWIQDFDQGDPDPPPPKKRKKKQQQKQKLK